MMHSNTDHPSILPYNNLYNTSRNLNFKLVHEILVQKIDLGHNGRVARQILGLNLNVRQSKLHIHLHGPVQIA